MQYKYEDNLLQVIYLKCENYKIGENKIKSIVNFLQGENVYFALD